MNKQPGTIAQAVKSNSLIETWTLVNWVPALVFFSILFVGAALDTVLDVPSSVYYLGVGIFVVCTIPYIISYYALRNVLVSTGVAKGDLDAISKGMGRSIAFTGLVAMPVFIAIIGVMAGAAKLLGFWDTFTHGLHAITQIAISLSLIVVSAFAGWMLKGRSVYEKYTRQIGVSDSD